MKTTIRYKFFGLTILTKETEQNEENLIKILEDRLVDVVVKGIEQKATNDRLDKNFPGWRHGAGVSA